MIRDTKTTENQAHNKLRIVDSSRLRDIKLILLIISSNVALITGVKFFEPEYSQMVGNLYFIITSCSFAFFSVFLAIRSEPKERKILFIFATFAVFRAIAELIWLVYESVLFVDPFPSIADLFWLLGYVFISIFLFQYLKPVRASASRSIKILAILIALAHLIPTGMSIYLINPESDYFEFLISLAYPIGDAVFLWQVTVGLTLLFNRKHNAFLSLMMGGIIGFIISDTLFVFMTESYEVGSIIDMGWLIGYILFLFAVFNYQPLSQNGTQIFPPIEKKSAGINLETTIKFVIPLITMTTIFVAVALIVNHFVLDDGNYLIDVHDDVYFFSILIAVFVGIIFIQNKNLLKFVKMRTDELERERDRLQAEVDEKVDALMKMERLNAIGELSARIAHDLRNPLTIIKSGFEIIRIKEPSFTKETHTILARIDRALIRMSHQIDNVLDYVSPKPLVMNEILLSELLKSVLERVTIPDGITVTLPDGDFEFKCDPFKMEIVFVNLITNAIQAMSNKGQIILTGSVNKKEITLKVTDTGPGIPSELLHKIFDPLFTTRLVGTGLGLPSCKSIIEKHGGNISIETQIGKGTAFIMKIPQMN